MGSVSMDLTNIRACVTEGGRERNAQLVCDHEMHTISKRNFLRNANIK